MQAEYLKRRFGLNPLNQVYVFNPSASGVRATYSGSAGLNPLNQVYVFNAGKAIKYNPEDSGTWS